MSNRVYALELVTGPTEEPVDFDDAKAHLKSEDDEATDDGLIALYLSAAREWAETFTNRALAIQTWKLKLDCFPYYGDGGDCRQGIKIPKPPLQKVESIYYYDSAGVSTLLPSTEYSVDKESIPGMIYPAAGKSWPSTYADHPGKAVEIIFKCGHSPVDDAPNGVRKLEVPSAIKLGILMQLAHLYEHRETVVIGAQPFEVPQSAERLCFAHRVLNV